MKFTKEHYIAKNPYAILVTEEVLDMIKERQFRGVAFDRIFVKDAQYNGLFVSKSSNNVLAIFTDHKAYEENYRLELLNRDICAHMISDGGDKVMWYRVYVSIMRLRHNI